MASGVALGTPGPTGAASERPAAGARGGSLPQAGDTLRLPGCAAGLAGCFGVSSTERLPTEVAITESMRRFTRIAHVAAAS